MPAPSASTRRWQGATGCDLQGRRPPGLVAATAILLVILILLAGYGGGALVQVLHALAAHRPLP